MYGLLNCYRLGGVAMDTAIALNVCAAAIHNSGIWEVFVITVDCVDICTHIHTHTHAYGRQHSG